MAKKVIQVENISKHYRLGGSASGDLRTTLSNGLAKVIGKSSVNQSPDLDFWALNDVSFDVEEGDVLGVVGRNGAGKSTLLKILSRITPPSSGKITLEGRVASLLEVGTGFHPELTGKENIFLNGSILGMSRKEIQDKLDDIIEFSGIKKFIHTPVKRYSSGMYVRLAFAVAAHLESEILVIDEVLAVGDMEFQKKCLGKMGDVAKSGRTILFVSHNLGAVNNLCNKGLYLKQGKVVAQAPVKEISSMYLNDINIDFKQQLDLSDLPDIPMRFTKIQALKNGQIIQDPVFDIYDQLGFEIEVECRSDVSNRSLMIHCSNGEEVVFSTFAVNVLPHLMEKTPAGRYVFRVVFPTPLFKEGRFMFDFEVGHFGVGPEQLIKSAISVDFEILSKNPRFEAYSANRPGVIAMVPDWKFTHTNI